jgi:deoxyribonuclease-4
MISDFELDSKIGYQIRTRQILDRLDLKALQASRVIPKIWDRNIEDLDSKALPEWVVRTKNYSKYGLQREAEIRKMIQSCGSSEKSEKKSSEKKHKTIETFENCTEMCKFLNTLDKWEFDQELSNKYPNGSELLGHPDLFSESIVADMKTTIHWSDTRMYAIAQLCVYALLSNVKKICVILPLSNQCAFHTFDNVKEDLYQLRKCVYNTLQFAPYACISYFETNYNVGYHVPKQTLLASYKEFKDKSIQIFLGNPKSASLPKISDDDMEKLQFVAKNNNLFVHAPYTVLLSNENKYVVNSIREMMQISAKIGVKGVVYHIGSGTEKAMLDNLRQVEQYISSDCPLIIETSCGEGNEILVDRQELIDFIKQLNLLKFRLCCDSCHMFSSPNRGTVYESMQFYESNIPGIISITHFNNSSHPRKSRKDKHAHYWGFISFDMMDKIASFCSSKNIPMVIE